MVTERALCFGTGQRIPQHPRAAGDVFESASENLVKVGLTNPRFSGMQGNLGWPNPRFSGIHGNLGFDFWEKQETWELPRSAKVGNLGKVGFEPGKINLGNKGRNKRGKKPGNNLGKT